MNATSINRMIKIKGFKNAPNQKIDKRWTGVKYGGSCEIRVTKTQYTYTLEFLYKNRLHRKDGPAFLKWHHDRLIAEKWYLHGDLHRPTKGKYGGPAVQTWHYTIGEHNVMEKNKVMSNWYSNGQLIKID